MAHAAGPDVSRSAAGRGAAEAFCLPTTLLPRFGVEWDAVDEHHLVARYRLDDTPIEAHYTIDDDGRLESMVFDRWGDPDETGTAGWHPFGARFTAHARFHGLTIPTAGRVGWFYGTDRLARRRILPLPDHRSRPRHRVTATPVVVGQGA